MVKSLEEFVAEATNAYAPAKQAVQSQLDSLQGQLDTANATINKNYAQQQAGLNRQRNMAASNASLQAAGSGGSFGGAANIANRKYYDQSFVPAQTQLQTNQANELANARQSFENQRTNLNSQLANLDATANQQALQQYWNAVEAEKQRQAAAAQAAQQNAYLDYLRQAMGGGKAGYTLDSNKNRFGGYNWYDPDGNAVKISSVAQADGGDFNDALFNRLRQAAQNGDGDYYSALVYNQMAEGLVFEPNVRNIQTGNNIYDTLGILPIGYR